MSESDQAAADESQNQVYNVVKAGVTVDPGVEDLLSGQIHYPTDIRQTNKSSCVDSALRPCNSLLSRQ